MTNNDDQASPGVAAPCVRCGEMTTERLGHTPICRACYDIRSSCCQEFGGDDLTMLPDDEPAAPRGDDQKV